MKANYECQGCFTEFKLRYDFSAPFCSEYCEGKFLDHAPVKLIASVYEDFKTFIDTTYVSEDDSSSVVEKEVVIVKKLDDVNDIDVHDIDVRDIGIIQCETCSVQLDYAISDSRVQYFCSSSCVDGFLNHVDNENKSADKSISIN